MQQSSRIHFIDILRGTAVVVMVLGHSIDAVLSADFRVSEAFRIYDIVRGFTAPVFLFVSGIAFTVATAKRWPEYARLSGPVLKRALRLLLILVLGYALHFPFFSLQKILAGAQPADIAQLFQVDVLHCLAVSLLLLQGLVLLGRTPERFARLSLAGAVVFSLAPPLLWNPGVTAALPAPLVPYLTFHPVSIFPLFPFGAFLFAGAFVGHAYLQAREARREAAFVDGLLAASVMAGAVGLLFDMLPVTMFPPHDYWKASPNFFLLRLAAVLLVTAAFHSWRRVPPVMTRHIVTLGQASLLVYVVHLVLVYGSAANPGLAQLLGRNLSALQALGVGVVVMLAMLGLVHGWNHLRARHQWPSRIIRFALVSGLLFFFITNPY
jgi:uncharacterized membrane protein